MGNKGQIYIQSRGLPVKCTEVDILEELCRKSDIDFSNTVLRMDGIYVASLWSEITLFLSNASIQSFFLSTFSAVTAEGIVAAIAHLVRRYHRKDHSNRKNKMTMIELKSPSANLRIESDNFTDEQFTQAFETFIKVSKLNIREDGKPSIPIYVVIDGEVKILSQNNYIINYVMPPKEDTEDHKNGQT